MQSRMLGTDTYRAKKKTNLNRWLIKPKGRFFAWGCLERKTRRTIRAHLCFGNVSMTPEVMLLVFRIRQLLSNYLLMIYMNVRQAAASFHKLLSNLSRAVKKKKETEDTGKRGANEIFIFTIRLHLSCPSPREYRTPKGVLWMSYGHLAWAFCFPPTPAGFLALTSATR